MKLHVVKRDNCPLWKIALFYLAAVLAALTVGGVLLAIMGVDPFAYYKLMFTMGTANNPIAYKTWINYLKDLVPLVLVSLGLSLSFKMRFWNIGGEGQFILGALAAATVAFKLGPELPGALTDSRMGAFVGKVVNTAAAQIAGTARLTLSEQTRPIRGGFVMVDDDVEVNCTFETLVRMQREKLEREVANVLFK